MELKAHQVDRFVSRPPSDLTAVLFFGPDQGAVHERATEFAKTVVPDLSDPFRVVDLEETRVVSDPALLWDEAAAVSMFGGQRVIRIRGAGNALAPLISRFLSDPAGDALVIVEAGDLQKTSPLRQSFAKADRGAALPCYADSADALETIVVATLRSNGLSADPDTLSVLVSRLGSDRGVTRSELEKLAVYALGKTQITEADVNAVLGDESALRIDEIADAAGLGDYVRLDRTLTRLWAAGTAPTSVLRRAMAHFQQVLSVREEIARGVKADDAVKRLRPPIHFNRSRSFLAQTSRWTSEKLLQALAQLYDAEALTRTTGVPEEAACSRALFAVAALVQTGRG